MKYKSTREANDELPGNKRDSRMRLMPERIPELDIISKLIGLDYRQLASHAIPKFLTDFTEDELRGVYIMHMILNLS